MKTNELIILLILLIIINIICLNDIHWQKEPRIFVSYAYHEKPNTIKNLEFFLKRVRKNENVHVMINMKGPTPSTKVSENKNVTILRTPNKGFDFGGHLENFELMGNKMNQYDYIVLMNDSACGPFFMKHDWYVPFINKLKNAEYVGVIANQGWFNMIKTETLSKIMEMIRASNINSYRDANMTERKIRNELVTDNILKIDHWYRPHTPFEAIFVKENRIGENKGTGKGALSYISLKEFENAKKQVELR